MGAIIAILIAGVLCLFGNEVLTLAVLTGIMVYIAYVLIKLSWTVEHDRSAVNAYHSKHSTGTHYSTKVKR